MSKEEKRLYDIEYRKRNKDILRAKKAAWFQRTYDPVEAAKKRKARMPYHVEYCRQPEYKRWKRAYDMAYRARRQFGEFWESAIILQDLENEILSRVSRYEIGLMNETINKTQKRRREYERLIGD